MTDWGPLMSEDADWWAVPGHVPPAHMLRQLLDERNRELARERIGPILFEDVTLQHPA